MTNPYETPEPADVEELPEATFHQRLLLFSVWLTGVLLPTIVFVVLMVWGIVAKNWGPPPNSIDGFFRRIGPYFFDGVLLLSAILMIGAVGMTRESLGTKVTLTAVSAVVALIANVSLGLLLWFVFGELIIR